MVAILVQTKENKNKNQPVWGKQKRRINNNQPMQPL